MSRSISIHPAELEPGCEPRCPGCRHRLLDAADSRASKDAFLRGRLGYWADRLEPVRAAPLRFGYREKVCLRAEWGGDRWKLGASLNVDNERVIIDIPDCPVHSERVRRVMRAVAREIPQSVPLAFVAVSGELVTLVVKARGFPAELRGVDWAAWGVRGVYVNLNAAAGDRVFAPHGWALLWGEEYAKDADGWTYGPSSFRQAMPGMASVALDLAAEFLRPGPEDFVVDLCSGSGVSVRRWLDAGARSLGVELSGESVRCAALNGAPLLQGRASERIPQLPKRASLLYANPPRLGLEPEVARWISEELLPERIAYLSCSAGTLGRDLHALEGYTVRRLIPFDFFPNTDHVETLALLVKTRE